MYSYASRLKAMRDTKVAHTLAKEHKMVTRIWTISELFRFQRDIL